MRYYKATQTKLKNLICFDISPEINLDRDYLDHQNLIEGSTYKNFWHPNFFVHFSNIFLTNKITEIQKVFPVRMEIDGGVTASPIVGDKKFVFNQYFQCDSLYSAMINQFIGAIKGNNNYIRCNQCRKWTLKIKVRKEKRLYCSDACRAKANRNRKTLDTYISLQVFKNYNSLADYVDAFLNQTLGKPGDPKNFFRKETDNENLIEFLERMVWDIILNFDALTNEQTIANHLGVEREFLGDLSFLRNKPFYSEIYLSNPYLDWDYNLSKEVR